MISIFVSNIGINDLASEIGMKYPVYLSYFNKMNKLWINEIP